MSFSLGSLFYGRLETTVPVGWALNTNNQLTSCSMVAWRQPYRAERYTLITKSLLYGHLEITVLVGWALNTDN